MGLLKLGNSPCFGKLGCNVQSCFLYSVGLGTHSAWGRLKSLGKIVVNITMEVYCYLNTIQPCISTLNVWVRPHKAMEEAAPVRRLFSGF